MTDNVTPFPGQHWLSQAQRSKNGVLKSNLNNAVLALRNDPMFREKFSFDEFARVVCTPAGPLTDYVLSDVQCSLQGIGFSSLSRDATLQAIEMVADEHPFHPVRDYLNSLTWDGQYRAADWTHVYLGTELSSYYQSVGHMFLVSLVARILQPGCKADYMIVLEGEQGILKSQACRVLTTPWFSDNLPDLATDPIRVSQHLRGKWLVEISELSAFSRAETSMLKSFLSRQEETFIPKFGRLEIHEPRQCIFAGTTNDDCYLKDETGGRRFWPIKCGTINLTALQRDRDQLFAEALDAYLHGAAQWWPDHPFENEVIQPQQTARLWTDAWTDKIAAYASGQSQLTIAQCAGPNCLDIPLPQLDTAKQKRIAAILRNIGWTQYILHGRRLWRK